MNKPENPRRALGRGLGALLPTRPPSQLPPSPAPPDDNLTLPINSIEPNPFQPRRIFQSEKLAELAQSIQANGIIQPLVVRKLGDRYELVAGERRWRAAKIAGLESVPVVVRPITDDKLLEVSLIENIQREDLNPMETAHAFEQLGREFNLSAEDIGRRTGKDRTTILNFLRLLNLAPEVQQLVEDRRLSAGHARCLLALPTPELQVEVAEKAVAEGWSVRQTERTTQRMMEGRKPKHPEEAATDPNVKAAIEQLERVLGTKVRIIERAKQKGKIEIDYYSAEDLDRIYNLITGES
ncbi:MAG: ParB/RepB/Spo0J family partition protein [Bryobacteraceae bacterium]|jgi:ParB family chromosome partitioning protein